MNITMDLWIFDVISNNMVKRNVCVCNSLALLPERWSTLHFSVNGFGGTLFPRHECIDTDVKIS